MSNTGNDQKAMAEFADALWENYIKPKYEEERSNNVSYYRATVIANNGNGSLTVKAPFDFERTVNCTTELLGASADSQVIIARLGDGRNAANHLAILEYMEEGSGGGVSGELGDIFIYQNGTYDATEEGLAGYGATQVAVDGGLLTMFAGEYVPGVVIDDDISYIRPYAAFYNSGITVISAANVTSVGSYAFYACTRLETINLPKCSSFGTSAFYSCSSMKAFIMNDLRSIQSGVLNGKLLKKVQMDACEYVGINALYNCWQLDYIKLPNCVSISNSAFFGCEHLLSAEFPKCKTVGTYAFYSCSSLRTAYFPQCTSIGNYAFAECHFLKDFYLTSVSAVTALGSGAFYSTPLVGYTVYEVEPGYVHVPASLYDAFVTATNWVSLSSRIVST